jgi:hypothetical protein
VGPWHWPLPRRHRARSRASRGNGIVGRFHGARRDRSRGRDGQRRFQREFAHSPEKLWRALTPPQLLDEWLMAGAPVVGHRFEMKADL